MPWTATRWRPARKSLELALIVITQDAGILLVGYEKIIARLIETGALRQPVPRPSPAAHRAVQAGAGIDLRPANTVSPNLAAMI